MRSITQLTVVIASPNDVKDERKTLNAVIETVNRLIAKYLGLSLQAVLWETDTYPGFHADGPQALIDSLLKIEDCDILVGIFWKRFGTPIKKKGRTGTEHEIHNALKASKKNGKPHIMLYFNQKEYFPRTPGESEQQTLVLKFKDKIKLKGLIREYSGKREFEHLIFEHLSQYLQDKFRDRNASPQQPSTSDKLLLKEIEKRSLDDKRQVIYNDLDKNIFSQLLDYELETLYDYPISRLKLNYDLSTLKENPDYEEAKLHWEQDLKDIRIDPEVIEAQVNALNKDVDMFFTSQIREPVIAAITIVEIFTAFESGTDIPPLNQISIPNVIKQLQSDWIEDTGVDKRYEKDTHYYVLGNTIIATIEPQNETRLDQIINSLRSKDNLISQRIHAFKERRDTIL
ncbi:MAG: DUF4062 domain-containing protein, partial [Candidatus Nitrosopolaris sp.]